MLRGNNMDTLENKTKVSYIQGLQLIIIYRVIIAFTYLPAVKSLPGNQDTWISAFLSIPYSILFCLPIIFLSNRFKDLNLIEYIENILGKTLGKIVALYYTVFLLIFNIAIVTILVEILNTTMLPNTPIWVTILMMLISCVYIAFKGLIPIARGAEIFVPFILGVILMFVILGYPNYDFSVLLPVLHDSTFKNINMGAIEIALKFSDIIILAMIAPKLERKEDLNKIFIRSILYSVLIVTLIIVVTQAALGIEFTKHANIPFFTFTRMVSLFDFIERIDALYVVAWITGNIGKISGYLYFTTVIFSQATGKDNSKRYIIPISIIIFIISLIINNRKTVLGVKKYFDIILLKLSLVGIFIIPLFVLIVYLFRKNEFN